MINRLYFFSTILCISILWFGCSAEQQQKQTHISAQFSLSDTLKKSNDLSGISLTIIQRDSADAINDTLFNVRTDSAGSFSGMVYFDEKRQYPAIISRRNNRIGQIGLILADGDSIRIEGKLPTLNESFTISSREHDAMADLDRINRNFQRIQQVAQSGVLQGDSLRQEIIKWSDIYWQIYEENKGTIASELSARNAVQLLEGADNEKMMKRIRSIQEQDAFSDLGATIGKNYIAKTEGLDPALAYLDSLASMTEARDKVMEISMEQIKLLYDSARVDAAENQLTAFKKKYADDSTASDWVETMSYDINYMSPGDFIPDFSFTDNGRTISRDSLMGSPYILEITRLSNRLYQDQFDRTVAIHSIYKNFGLKVITIPLDESQVTIDAFFEERTKPWPVADAQTFDQQKLIKEFNIRLIPTRFLIDRQGKIVRKYVGKEYQDVINGIQTIIQNEKEPAL